MLLAAMTGLRGLMQKTLFAQQPNTEQQRSGMASKRSARRTVKRMEQDIINISDSEGTIIISDSEDEAGMSSSEDEAPPPKRRQIGQAQHGKGNAKAESASSAAEQAAGPTTASIPAKPGAAKSLSPPSNPSAVDACCSLAGTAQVVPGHDVMLTQTNIGKNSNSFYRLQWLRQPGKDFVWTRWGRVGVRGQSKLLGPSTSEEAKKVFNSKFRLYYLNGGFVGISVAQKSGAAWENQELARTFRVGKHCLVEVDSSTPTKAVKIRHKPSEEQQYLPCKVPAATRQLMELIFEEKMFTEALQGFELDMVRMPLGQLSTAQVQRGYEVLERLRDALAGLSSDDLVTLSSELYTTIPHDFKRSRPPVINTMKALELKFRILDVLSDIGVVQDLLEDATDCTPGSQLLPHPADKKYRTLGADLQVVNRPEQEYQIIQQYVKATSSNLQLLNLWRVDRPGEGQAFEAHAHLGNRRLLWHGTHIATVAAILKAGLRIMPHAGGRVGRGLYLASENSKSAMHVRCGCTSCQMGSYVGVMFLAETVMGREHHIIRDDFSLRQPPSGFDSVVAKGVRAPDLSRDKALKLEGRRVKVPVGPPVPAQQYAHSSFLQDEYVVYKESQARVRYMLMVKFD